MNIFAILVLSVAMTTTGVETNAKQVKEKQANQPAKMRKPVDYKTAYQRAQKGDKPLLVLVTATWCPPCRVMKSNTIPELLKRKAFRDYHFATVDVDKERKLALQLVEDRSLPHLIVFEKNNNKWTRRYLQGAQSVAQVEAFVSKSKNIRTADVRQSAGNKKSEK